MVAIDVEDHAAGLRAMLRKMQRVGLKHDIPMRTTNLDLVMCPSHAE